MKYFIGPMSKNVVDAIIDFGGIGFIPSRRQVEYNGGYVNNWTTKEFSNYVNGRAVIQRDHGGAGQGYNKQSGPDGGTSGSGGGGGSSNSVGAPCGGATSGTSGSGGSGGVGGTGGTWGQQGGTGGNGGNGAPGSPGSGRMAICGGCCPKNRGGCGTPCATPSGGTGGGGGGGGAGTAGGAAGAAITGGGFTLTGDTSSDRVKGSTP